MAGYRRRGAEGGIEFQIELDQEAINALLLTMGTQVMFEIGQVGEAEAKRLAPVDTGTLRRSITYEVQESGELDETSGYGLVASVRIGTNIAYAVFQELGTRNHPAHPFLRPTIPAIESYIKGRR